MILCLQVRLTFFHLFDTLAEKPLDLENLCMGLNKNDQQMCLLITYAYLN